MILTYQDANNVFRKGNVLENSANVNGNGNGFNYFLDILQEMKKEFYEQMNGRENH